MKEALTIIVSQDRAKATYPSAGPLSSNLTDCTQTSLALSELARVVGIGSDDLLKPLETHRLVWFFSRHGQEEALGILWITARRI